MSDAVRGVLSADDLAAVRSTFGVDEEQVRRDHVISHALAALTHLDHSRLVFFGGTALSRTHLPTLRLSEDIDLIALDDRPRTAMAIQDELTDSLRRSFPTPHFVPDLPSAGGSRPSTMSVGDVNVQIQLLDAVGYPAWPTEVVDLEQRYADAPPARLRVLTAPAFAAAKLSAWNDRHAARDLYDLWGLADRGLIDAEARDLFARFGPFTDASRVSFGTLPTPDEWNVSLAHQGIVRVGPDEAAAVVRAAWAAA